ncbi:MAG TPA: hypothetical protein VIF62_35070, partial [Labilithrix sp.]
MRRVAVFTVLAAMSCGGSGAGDAAIPPAECTEDCAPVVPDGACGVGTAPIPTSHACTPVGWTDACPDGFAPAASGWGCAPVMPADACSGATKPVLGQTTCVPIGDCDAPFPPDGAIVVAGSIAAALASAPRGATIAIPPGTYVESLVVRHDVRIVGKCARDVIVRSDGGAAAGLDAQGAVASLEGVTLTGHLHGVSVGAAADVLLRDVLVDGAREVGVAADGAMLTLDGVVVRGTLAAADGSLGRGLDIGDAKATIDGSAIESSVETGLLLRRGQVTLTRSIVAHTLGGTSGGGRGVYVSAGGTLDADRVAIVDSGEIGLYVTGAVTQASVEESVMQATRPTDAGLFGRGVVVSAGAAVALRKSAVRASHDAGVLVTDASMTIDASVIDGVDASPAGAGAGLAAAGHATVNVTSSAFVSASAVGLTADASDVSLHGSAVLGTRPDAAGALGVGALAKNGARLVLERSAVDRARYAGVVARDDGTELSLSHAWIGAVRAQADGAFGHGLVALAGARADARTSVIRGCDRDGLFYSGARGVVDRGLVTENAVGAHAQDGSAIHASSDTVTPAESG